MHGRFHAVLAFFIGFASIAAAAGRAFAEARYQVTPLGQFYPTAVNEHGQVAGYTGATLDGRRGALWLPAAAYGLAAGLNDLGAPFFATPSSGVNVSDINDLGQIAATVINERPGGTPEFKAALWLPSTAYGRPAGWSVLDETQVIIIANSINNSGQVATRSDLGGSVWLPAPAFGRPAGSYAAGGWMAADINEAGQVAGSTTSGGSAPFVHLPVAAFGREAGNYQIPVGPGGGGTGPFDAFGNAINDRGQVVGSWTPPTSAPVESQAADSSGSRKPIRSSACRRAPPPSRSAGPTSTTPGSS